MSDGMDRDSIAGRIRCIKRCDPRDCVFCEAAHFLESESSEGAVKDRALRVACHGLGIWAADADYDRRDDWVLRMRDQCLNAISGKLSSDPLHRDIGHQYGPKPVSGTRGE